MPKLTTIQTSFSSGELSPLMKGRTSLAQYANGCSTLQNMVVLPQGGITKRPGTKFIHEVKDSADITCLKPFIVGVGQSYVLEFGDGYIRFYRDGGILLSTAAVANGTFATDLTDWTDGDTGTGASIWNAGVMRLAGGAAGVGIRTQAITYVGTSQHTLTFTSSTNTCSYRIGTTSGGTEITSGTSSLGVNTVTFTPATAGTIYLQFRNANNNNADIDAVSIDTPIYQLASPYTSGQVESVQWAQSKDTMYLAHPDVALRKLRRFGASQWDIVAVDLVDGPYFPKTHDTYGGVGTGFAMDTSANTGSVTVTTTGAVFVSSDVGRKIRYRSSTSNEWSELTITAYTNSTNVTALVEKAIVAHAASTEWRLGAFSESTGYPSCVTFHEQRLVLANSNYQPQTVWFSRAGDIEVFQPDNDAYKDEVDATSAMTYTVSSRDTNDIAWLSSRNVLFLGTKGAVFTAKASSLDEAITPNNISIKPAVLTAAHPVMPIETTNATLFIHQHQRKVMELAYNVQQDNMVAVDLSILADHLGTNRFKQIVRQAEPYNILWGITEVGDLVGLTYLRDQQVVGWHSHIIGGTDVDVKSLAVIPGDEETELWMIVSRTIDGSTKQYVERLHQFLRSDITDEAAVYVDSSITYSGTSTSSFTGLDHLEGVTPTIWSDGYVGTPTGEVTAGALSTQESSALAHFGFPYTVAIQTMPADANSAAGPTNGSLIRGWKSFVRLYRSALIKIGYSSAESDIVETLSDGYIMGGGVELYTGIKELAFQHGAELELATYIEQTQPAPLTILTIGTKLLVDDDR